MSQEEQKTANETPVQPSMPTREYFTKEVNEAISSMTEEEMLRELANIEQTRAWVAILKYNQIRLQQSQTAIISGDPFKEPTNIARHQGVMLGLSDLQNAVILLKKERDEAAETKASAVNS